MFLIVGGIKRGNAARGNYEKTRGTSSDGLYAWFGFKDNNSMQPRFGRAYH